MESQLSLSRERGVFEESPNVNLSLLSTTPVTPASSLNTTHNQANSSVSQRSTSSLCDVTTHLPPKGLTAYFDDENPLPCSSMALQSTEVYHRETSQIITGQRNKRNTSAVLCPSAVPHSPQHLQSRESYIEDTTPCVTNAREVNRADYGGSEMYVFPGVNISQSNTSGSYQTLNGTVPTHDIIDNNEEENPLINPTHPIVNTGTLASFNGGVDPPVNSDVPMTPHTVTLVTALTHSAGDICHPTSSGHSATRMSHM